MSVKYKYQNLHCHTATSDGKLSHLEVLDICEKNNIGVVAFCDHDSVPKKEILIGLRNAKFSTKWIIGIEISSGMPSELSRLGGDLHIAGLFVNPFDTHLVEHCKKMQASRIERMQKMVRSLRSIGFNITEDDCLKASGGESVGRPHIVTALKSKNENLLVIEKLRKKMKEEAKRDASVNQKYQEMMKLGKDQYPYALFMGDESYISGIYIQYLYKLELDKTVETIRNAGGLAFLAHWFTDKQKLDEVLLGKLLKEDRLDGVETVYGLNALSRKELMDQRKVLLNLIGKYNKLESGGSDAHTKEDFELFPKTRWYAELTEGMVENIVMKSKVDTSYSSLGNLV